MTPIQPRTPNASWATARDACRDPDDLKRLAEVVASGTTPLEFSELTRARFRRPHKDHPTPHAYRQSLKYFHSHASQEWLHLFRENGGRVLPPRTPEDLKWSPGEFGIGEDSPLWSWHTSDFRKMITTRACNYFKLPETYPLHVNAWSAAWRAYYRERASV